MTAKTSFRGSFTALVTPFKNGALDEKAFRDLVDWQIAEGTNGLVPVGTTGESPTLSHDEHKQVVEWCVDQVDGRVPVVAGAGSNSTAEAVELSKHAEKAGADAVLIVTPYYNKPTQEGLYQHYKAINDAIGIPIIIYNIPGRSIVDMSVDTMKRLFECKNIAGVKDATANMARVSQQRAAIGEDFNQMSGEDITALGFMAHGGHGCISVTSNVAPRLCAEFQARLPEGRLQDRAQAAGQAGAVAHQSVRRNQPGADQVCDVADRQVRQYAAAADGAGERKGASRRARSHGARRLDQLDHVQRVQEIRAARQCDRSRHRRDHRRRLRRHHQLAGRRRHHAGGGGVHRRPRFFQLLHRALAQGHRRHADRGKKQGAVLAWGNFLTIVINFVIIAFVLFLAIRAIGRMVAKEAEKPAAPSKQEQLLTEIRDLLKQR